VSWTIKKKDETELNALKIIGLRQILQVSWAAMKSNKWVLETAGVERELLDAVKLQKLSYYRLVMQKRGDYQEKDIMQGTMPGSHARGRLRTTWMDNI